MTQDWMDIPQPKYFWLTPKEVLRGMCRIYGFSKVEKTLKELILEELDLDKFYGDDIGFSNTGTEVNNDERKIY